MKRSRSAAFLGCTLLILSGCGEKDRLGSAALDAAIVPGADLAGRVDYSLLRKAPVFETLRRIRLERDPERARKDEERARKIEESAGLGRKDLQALLFTADLDSVDFSTLDEERDFRRIKAALGVSFHVNVAPEQIEAALQAMAAENPGTVVESTEIGKRGVFTVAEDKGAPPFLFVARSHDGDAVFATLNAGSMRDLLARESGERAEKIPAALANYDAHVPDGSQFRASVVLPDGMRRMIGEKTEVWQSQASQNPGMSLIISFIAPFRKLAGVSVGSRFDEGVEIGMAADLAGEEEALQAGAILQTMVLPLLKAKVAQSNSVDPRSLEEKVHIGATGSVVALGLKLEETDLRTLNQESSRGASRAP